MRDATRCFVRPGSRLLSGPKIVSTALCAPHHEACSPPADILLGFELSHHHHPLQLPPAAGVGLAAGMLEGRAHFLQAAEQHGSQLAVHVRQLLGLGHILSWVQRKQGSESGAERVGGGPHGEQCSRPLRQGDGWMTWANRGIC